MVNVTGSPKAALLELAAISREALRVCAIAVPVLTTSACPTITNKRASRLISFSSLYSHQTLYCDPIPSGVLRIWEIRPTGTRDVVPAGTRSIYPGTER
jgi:hypothetical protein